MLPIIMSYTDALQRGAQLFNITSRNLALSQRERMRQENLVKN